MRKCGSCGALLLGDVDACARCGTPLVGAAVAAGPAPAAAAAPPGGPPATLAPSFGRLSIPPPGAPAPAPGSSAGPGDALPLREQWQPVAMPAPEAGRSPRATRRGLIALAVVVALGAGIIVTHLGSDPLPPGTSAFVAGGGVTYTSPDGAFQIQLPQAPELTHTPVTIESETETLYVAAAATKNYVIVGGSITFASPLAASQVDEALNAVVDAGVKGVEGKMIEKSATTHGTLPAVEAKFKAPDGYNAQILVVLSGVTLVTLVVHSKTGTDRLFKALESSLILR